MVLRSDSFFLMLFFFSRKVMEQVQLVLKMKQLLQLPWKQMDW